MVVIYGRVCLLGAYFTILEAPLTTFLMTVITDIICVSFSFLFLLLDLLGIFHFYSFSKNPTFGFKSFSFMFILSITALYLFIFSSTLTCFDCLRFWFFLFLIKA